MFGYDSFIVLNQLGGNLRVERVPNELPAKINFVSHVRRVFGLLRRLVAQLLQVVLVAAEAPLDVPGAVYRLERSVVRRCERLVLDRAVINLTEAAGRGGAFARDDSTTFDTNLPGLASQLEQIAAM